MAMRRGLGFAVVLLGLAVALFPLWSVWRVSGQVLDELPPIDGQVVDDRSPVSAMASSDFRLATRIYSDADPEVVESALLAAGFTRSGPDGQLSRECCGEFDAVWVDLVDGDDGSTVARLTTADADAQAAVPIFALFGLFLVAAGLGLVMMAGGATRASSAQAPVG